MEIKKYGYNSIEDKKGIQDAAKKDKNAPSEHNPPEQEGFVKWSDQKDWGLPGETLNNILKFEDFLGKAKDAGKIIQKERKPTKFVGW